MWFRWFFKLADLCYANNTPWFLFTLAKYQLFLYGMTVTSYVFSLPKTCHDDDICRVVFIYIPVLSAQHMDLVNLCKILQSCLTVLQLYKARTMYSRKTYHDRYHQSNQVDDWCCRYWWNAWCVSYSWIVVLLIASTNCTLLDWNHRKEEVLLMYVPLQLRTLLFHSAHCHRYNTRTKNKIHAIVAIVPSSNTRRWFIWISIPCKIWDR